MKSQVFCFNPTSSDSQSKVRGVGRYLQILEENFGGDWNFISDLSKAQSPGFNLTFVNPFFNLLRAPLTLKRIASKQIAVIHDLIPLKYPEHFPFGLKGKLNIFLNKRALKQYDRIVTDSEASKKDIVLMLRVPEEKVWVIYPVLPKLFLKKDSQIQKNGLPLNFCLYVGDATWNKNLVTLARAIKEMNVTCVFAGKVFETKDMTHPWQKELRDFMVETKNDKRFIFKGYVTDEELVTLYRQATVNVLPSRDEGFGFSYLEAASQGTPSILSDIPVFREISQGKGVIFANPDDVSSLANAVGEVYFRKGKKEELGNEAYQWSKEFSRESFIHDWKTVIA